MAEGFGFYQKTPFLATLIRALHLLPLLLFKTRSFLLLPPSQEEDVFHIFLFKNLESTNRALAFKAALVSQLVNLRIADVKS